MVGPPAPVFERAASSVMPKKPVSSAPEYVVGMATCLIDAWSAYDEPGAPDSCSRKKHTALPRSAHDPPPKLTPPSMPSPCACRSASCTTVVGTCERTPVYVDAIARPIDRMSRCPAG